MPKNLFLRFIRLDAFSDPNYREELDKGMKRDSEKSLDKLTRQQLKELEERQKTPFQ